MSLRSRLDRLERAARESTSDGRFLGSPRFWATLAGHPPADLSEYERAELASLFAPAADPDPVEAQIRRVEALAAAPNRSSPARP